jgi:hypothetical protein
VRPKGNIRLLPSAETCGEGAAKMREQANVVANFYPDRMGGFVIVAWGMDGAWSRALYLRPECFVGQTLVPAFVSEILRRDVAADVTREVLRGEA